MKLPAGAVIATDKLTNYLLVPKARGDKSIFLMQAGYTLNNGDQLLGDLRTQVLLHSFQTNKEHDEFRTLHGYGPDL
jgi:hypothetical protein